MKDIRLDPYENLVANLPANIWDYYYTDNIWYTGYSLNSVNVNELHSNEEDWLIKIPEGWEMRGKDILYEWVKENYPQYL